MYMYIHMYIYICTYMCVYICIYLKGFAPAAGPFTCNNLQIYKAVSRKLQLLKRSDMLLLRKLLLCYVGSVCSHESNIVSF